MPKSWPELKSTCEEDQYVKAYEKKLNYQVTSTRYVKSPTSAIRYTVKSSTVKYMRWKDMRPQ